MTFYFYDLETSGVNPREQRIMQFAGQRTNDKLEPIGDVDDVLVALSEDVLPEPWAILTHRITPQKSVSEGISEAEFLKWFEQNVTQPDTVFVGYNSIRFDDEFMRYAHYRNFFDPYEWQWQDGRSKWDLLDVVRMTRALRPEGIKWPFSSDGKPAAKLGLMTAVNGISHEDAHTADSDVKATVALAKLLKDEQPKLFNYLLEMRDKKKVAKLCAGGEPFVYTSGRYSSDFHKTTIAVSLGDHPEQAGSIVVYDLRFDPDELAGLSSAELTERIFVKRDSKTPKLPAKAMALNKCPAVAPVGVLNKKAQENIQIDLNIVETNLKKLRASDVGLRILDAFAINHKSRQATFLTDDQLVDAQLYDGFFNGADKKKMLEVRQANSDVIDKISPVFNDGRLEALLPLYKARNHKKSLSPDEQSWWQTYLKTKLYSGKPSRLELFGVNLQKATESVKTGSEDEYLLSELKLYVESNLPELD